MLTRPITSAIVAVVLASTKYQAADAVEGVVVDYEVLPAVASIDAAVADTHQAHSICQPTRPTTGPSSRTLLLTLRLPTQRTPLLAPLFNSE
ncbi:MAG: hypothetical protein R2706_16955 [Acidimicrobiales bacterium]